MPEQYGGGSGLGGVTVTGTPTAGQVPVASSGTAAAWGFQNVSAHNVKSYGAKGDGKATTDAAMTAGSATLICATSTPFTSTAVDAGKYVVLMGAGAAGAPLVTTILSVTDAGHAVLAANASTTVSGAVLHFGTDDTAALQAAIDGVSTAGGQLFLPAGIYMVAGTLQTAASVGAGLGYPYNAQLRLPARSVTTSPAITIEFVGEYSMGHGAGYGLGLENDGTILMSTLTGQTRGAQGWPSLLGGPSATAEDNNFTNLHVAVRNIGFRQAVASVADLFFMKVASAHVADCRSDAADTGINVQPDTHGFGAGVVMPTTNNMNDCRLDDYVSQGRWWGAIVGEHITASNIQVFGCAIGLGLSRQSNDAHSGAVLSLQTQNVAYHVYLGMKFDGSMTPGGAGTVISLDILNWQLEDALNSAPTWQHTVAHIYDPNNLNHGLVRYRRSNTNSGFVTGPLTNSGAANTTQQDLSTGILQSAASQEATTGAGAALLGSNCPATTLAAPYKWIKQVSSDGSVVYIPAWK